MKILPAPIILTRRLGVKRQAGKRVALHTQNQAFIIHFKNVHSDKLLMYWFIKTSLMQIV
jgi:hypothetical protein